MRLGFFVLLFSLFLTSFAKADALDDCINKNANKSDVNVFVFCPVEESKKMMKNIEFYLEELVKLPNIEKWNNGNGMFNGNMKTMLDSWIVYRNKRCSLAAAYGSLPAGEDPQIVQAKCLYKVIKDLEWEMKDMYDNRFNTDASS